MKREKMDFVKKLIEDQMVLINGSDESNYNNVALGLFSNDAFNQVVIDLKGSDFLWVFKSDARSDTKSRLLNDLEMIVKAIEGETIAQL